MHEYGLTRTLLGQVEAVCRAHHGRGVTAVAVEVGPLSGVEPLLIRSAFAQLVPGTVAEQAELEIREVPLEARCRNCRADVTVEAFRFVCAACGGSDLQVLRGDQFVLVSVTVRDEPVGCPDSHEVHS